MEGKRFSTIAVLFATLLMFGTADVFSREGSAPSSDLPVKWGELTAPDFVDAVKKSGGVCVIPLGVFE